MAERDTMAVLDHHIEAALAKNVDMIMSDYAEDAILITNLTEQPLIGFEAIKEFCKGIMQGEPDPNAAPPKFIAKEANNELGFLVFKGENNSVGAETYVVKNGKIVFESAVFKNS